VAQNDEPTPVWLFWSSGKDSAWSLRTLAADSAWRVTALVSTLTEAFRRVSMHGTPEAVLAAQATAADLPLERMLLPYPCPNEAYEAAFANIAERARAAGVRHVAFGDLHLSDVRAYRERVCADVGLTPVFPIWGRETHALAREMTAHGLKATIVCLDPSRLDRGFAGRDFDARFLEDLPAEVDPCGENGEFHTCVHAGPMFSRPLQLATGETVERDGFLFTDIQLA